LGQFVTHGMSIAFRVDRQVDQQLRLRQECVLELLVLIPVDLSDSQLPIAG